MLIPIDQCDLELANHGESGVPPEEYAFAIKAGQKIMFKHFSLVIQFQFFPHHLGGYEYFVEVKAKVRAAHYLGEDLEAKNIELFTNYKVNGVPGSGIVEWNYRNVNKVF